MTGAGPASTERDMLIDVRRLVLVEGLDEPVSLAEMCAHAEQDTADSASGRRMVAHTLRSMLAAGEIEQVGDWLVDSAPWPTSPDEQAQRLEELIESEPRHSLALNETWVRTATRTKAEARAWLEDHLAEWNALWDDERVPQHADEP